MSDLTIDIGISTEDRFEIAEDDDRPDTTEMIRRLVKGQEAVARTAR